MRGSLVQRYEGSWSVVLDLGYEVDPATGKKRRNQKWITVHGTRRDAEKELAKHVTDVNRGDFVQPSKMTFGAWLDEWLEKAIKPPAKAPSTYEHYKGVIARHLKPKLGMIPLQQLRSTDLKRAYLEAAQGDAAAVAKGRWGHRKGLAPGTVAFHHNIASAALQAAMLEGLVQRNVAKVVVGKPRQRNDGQDVLEHCWTAPEAKAFVATVKDASPQTAAFYALALDTGARRNELAGLRWSDLDLVNSRVRIERQLRTGGASPAFGPTKNKMPRTIEISAETVALLRKHRGNQAEIKLHNGAAYRDLGLVFAKEPVDRRWLDRLGDPIQVNHLDREFKKLARAAGVRPIKLHGCRHTSATLLLQAGVPPHVVQQRLGHRSIAITLGVYAHALPVMQQDAAAKLGALLHGEDG
jgi:integrase